MFFLIKIAVNFVIFVTNNGGIFGVVFSSLIFGYVLSLSIWVSSSRLFMSFKVGILTALLIASLWFVINVSKGEKQLCVVKKMFLVGSLYDLVFLGDQNSLSELRVGDCD